MRTRNNIWNPDFLLREPKSKLSRCNLNVGTQCSRRTHRQELICQHAWDLLPPEDQAECISHLPPFDVATDNNAVQDSDCTVRLKLVDGFFEKNISLQGDMRAFQVSSVMNRTYSRRPI